MVSYGLLRRVALVRTDVSEEPGASFIRVTRIGELGTTKAATRNRRTLRRRFLQAPHGVTTQKTPFFKIVLLCIVVFTFFRQDKAEASELYIGKYYLS
jgi:hypothetical protein